MLAFPHTTPPPPIFFFFFCCSTWEHWHVEMPINYMENVWKCIEHRQIYSCSKQNWSKISNVRTVLRDPPGCIQMMGLGPLVDYRWSENLHAQDTNEGKIHLGNSRYLGWGWMLTLTKQMTRWVITFVHRVIQWPLQEIINSQWKTKTARHTQWFAKNFFLFYVSLGALYIND